MEASPTTLIQEPMVDVTISDSDLVAQSSRGLFNMSVKAVKTERHIGIDQGRRNFAIVAVDKEIDKPPIIRTAEKNDLGLPKQLSAADVLSKILEMTQLRNYMQQTDDRELTDVERVVVHLEQMSPKNKYWKQFGIELGQLLQGTVNDHFSCIVKLSHPNLLRAGGVIDHFGERIVQELELVPMSYGNKMTPRPAQSAPPTQSDDSSVDAMNTKKNKRYRQVRRYRHRQNSGGASRTTTWNRQTRVMTMILDLRTT